MKKKFLVTISNESEQPYAVRILCFFFSEISTHSVTLLHLRQRDCTDDAVPLAGDTPGEARLAHPPAEVQPFAINPGVNPLCSVCRVAFVIP